MTTESRALFPLGQIVATPGALAALAEAGESPLSLLMRHQSGDWGTLDREDRCLNDRAVEGGDRILSAYGLPSTGQKVWVITESDRSSTCVLLPEEY